MELVCKPHRVLVPGAKLEWVQSDRRSRHAAIPISML